LKISTNSFTKSEVEFLADMLTKKFDVKFSVCKDSLEWYKKKNPNYIERDNYYILTYTDGANRFFSEIESVFPLGMERKINIWKGTL